MGEKANIQVFTNIYKYGFSVTHLELSQAWWKESLTTLETCWSVRIMYCYTLFYIQPTSAVIEYPYLIIQLTLQFTSQN